MKKTSAVLTFASLTVLASAAQATVYDAVADFQVLSNPGAVWSYGYAPQGGANYALTLFDSHGASNWYMAAYNVLGTPAAWKSSATQLALHPGPSGGGDFAVLRFTAPSAGNYSISGQFFAGDIGAMSGAIVRSGNQASPLQYFASTNDQSVFSVPTLQLTAGETLDFVVGNNGSFYYGTTPLTVSITGAVPEPGSYALMGLGLAGLALLKRRRAV